MQGNQEIPGGNSRYQSLSQNGAVHTAPSPLPQRKRLPYRMSGKEFIKLTSLQERTVLRESLDDAILHFLRGNRAVYLDGLGIVYPSKQKRSVIHDVSDSQSFVRDETVICANFEKCYDLIDLHRERFAKIAEVAELQQHMYPRMPLQMQIRWDENQLGRLLRGLIRSIREEVVIDGGSSQLKQLGRFFALHNRQGDTPDDWFAGSDIFLQSNFCEPVAVSSGKIFAKPILHDAWELLEARWGTPCAQFEMNIAEELSKIGYDCNSIEEEFSECDLKIPVAAFKTSGMGQAGEDVILYCTDGMRYPAADLENSIGTELTFQLSLQNSGDSNDEEASIPRWPLRVLALGWVLMISNRDRRITTGAGLSADMPLVPHFDTGLTGIFATRFEPVRSLQLAEHGCFEYVNLIGITEDEIEVLESHGAEQLAMLLQFRKLSQITRPTRSSVISRTGLAPKKKLLQGERCSA